VAPSDATEKNRNIGAQLQSILYTTAQKRFGKIYFLYDFCCAQTCSFRAVFGPPVRSLTIMLSPLYNVMRKNLYRRTSTFSALSYGSGIIIQISRLSTRSGAHKLFRRLLDFSQFLTALSRKLWRHLATKLRTM